jgi:hypothetical protein
VKSVLTIPRNAQECAEGTIEKLQGKLAEPEEEEERAAA